MDVNGPADNGDSALRSDVVGSLLVPIACYLLTTIIVVGGVAFGRALLPPSPIAPGARGPDTFIGSFTVWDGGWYRKIAEEGYSFNPSGESTFAFFPAYPLLTRGVAWVTRLKTDPALVLTAHLCLVVALVVFYRYARDRTRGDCATAQLAVVSAVLVPTTFFFRVAYAESLLLLVVVLVLFGIERRWPVLWLALLVGLGTATRPSGGALLLPFALFLRGRSDEHPPRIARFAWLLVGCWGILAFMAFAGFKFGDPIAFVHAQAKWHVRPHVPLSEKIIAILTFGAIRGVYREASPFYWGRFFRMTPTLFNLYFANSLYFAGTIVATAIGGAKGWLNRFEVALVIGLVGIPYLAHNYETTMMASGRYMTTVVPTYIVLGHLLRRLPLGVTVAVAGLSAFMLGAYAALFGMWYWLI